MMTYTKRITGVLVALGALACQDLDVTNPNEADRARALSNPTDVEALIAGSWLPYYYRTQVQAWPYHAMNAIAGVHSTSVANNGALALSEIPRPVYDNNPLSEVSGLARFPWYDYYSGLDNANEGLKAIEGGLVIRTPESPGGAVQDNTDRARAFAKFGQGLTLGYLGLMYDQALIATEDSDLEDPSVLEPKPFQEVIEAAIASMEEAIAITAQTDFELPGSFWINGYDTDDEGLARLAHSFIARFLVLSARTEAEREAVDWSRVLSHLDQGITEDFVIQHTQQILPSSNYKRRIQLNAFNGFLLSNFLLGVLDVSGNFQDWLATPLAERMPFLVTTPDRRITGDTPTSNGKYMRYQATNSFRDERGTWRQSFYQYRRWGGEWRDAPLVLMTVDEMRLLRAEAYARTGREDEAAALVNVTRVANGELPPVTAAGVPVSADCVPRTYEGACEDLLGAIWYERIIETTGLESPRDWMEQRGWDRLYEGTFLQLPIPGRELETLGLPIYTFGGSGPGSAQ